MNLLPSNIFIIGLLMRKLCTVKILCPCWLSEFIISTEVIKGNGKLIPQAVKLWVERYEKDAKPATVELLTMLFEVIWETF